jgi:hypothetical protein
MKDFFKEFFETMMQDLGIFTFALINTVIILAYVIGIVLLSMTVSYMFLFLILPCIFIHTTLLEMYS